MSTIDIRDWSCRLFGVRLSSIVSVLGSRNGCYSFLYDSIRVGIQNFMSHFSSTLWAITFFSFSRLRVVEGWFEWLRGETQIG